MHLDFSSQQRLVFFDLYTFVSIWASSSPCKALARGWNFTWDCWMPPACSFLLYPQYTILYINSTHVHHLYTLYEPVIPLCILFPVSRHSAVMLSCIYQFLAGPLCIAQSRYMWGKGKSFNHDWVRKVLISPKLVGWQRQPLKPNSSWKLLPFQSFSLKLKNNHSQPFVSGLSTCPILECVFQKPIE